MLDSFKQSLETTITLQFEEMLSPLQNEITSLLNAALGPILDQLSIAINALAGMVGDNPMGATLGGIGGAVVGAMVGHPGLGAMIGAILGAVIEQYFPIDTYTIAGTPPILPGVMMTQQQFEAKWISEHPLSSIPPGYLAMLYAEYVNLWEASQPLREGYGGGR